MLTVFYRILAESNSLVVAAVDGKSSHQFSMPTIITPACGSLNSGHGVKTLPDNSFLCDSA